MDRRKPLEAIVAHGARMSWAGILRPGDEFPTAVRSRLAVVTSLSGPPVRRCFGSWSGAYRRFTSNLTSPRLKVLELEPGRGPEGGIPCVLHWVRRGDVVSSGKGSVCHGDGWPARLWDAFISELGGLPEGTVAEKLRSFLDSHLLEEDPAVSDWRRSLGGGEEGRPRRGAEAEASRGWLPVPAKLACSDGDLGACLVSWDPGAYAYDSLTEALESVEAAKRRPDPASQARYYAECMLGRLHGVEFGAPGDCLEDHAYALRPEVRRVQETLARVERERLADPSRGRLDRLER